MKDKNTLLYIEKLRTFGQNYGLFRTERLLELMGSPEKKIKLIHVAGTNGKGSTSAMIGKVLEYHGYKVGYFNSPHLEELEESIRINEKNIREDELINLFNYVKPLVEQVINEGFNHPTEFEVLTCIMFKYLCDKKVDFGVVEVGLGGRLDSTNVITPIISVITPISMDHMNILGNTLGEIVQEKAGIIKNNVPIISATQEKEAEEKIQEKSSVQNSKLTVLRKDDYKLLEIIKKDEIIQRVEVKLNNKNEKLDLPLLGEHQIENLALAIKTLEELQRLNYVNLDNRKVYEGVKSVKWKGRAEVLKTSPTILIDGAHNIKGIESLKKTIESYFDYENLYLVLGILKDKEVEKMLQVILPLAKEIVTLTPNSNRAMKAEELKEKIKNYNKNVKSFDNYNEGITYSLSLAKERDLVVFAGSLYMIGEIRSLILAKDSTF